MRVFLVDSEPIFRKGLKSIIEAEHDLTVVGESDTCRDLLQSAKEC